MAERRWDESSWDCLAKTPPKPSETSARFASRASMGFPLTELAFIASSTTLWWVRVQWEILIPSPPHSDTRRRHFERRRNRVDFNLWRVLWGREFNDKSHDWRFFGDGESRARHERLPILYYDDCNVMAGWKAHSVRKGYKWWGEPDDSRKLFMREAKTIFLDLSP